MPRRHSVLIILVCGVGLVGLSAAAARAAGPPAVGAVWSSQVVATSARLEGEISPNGFLTFYHFDYLTEAAYQANLEGGGEEFAGATKVPAGAEAPIGSGTTVVTVKQALAKLAPETAYRYRLVAKSSSGTSTSPTLRFNTQGFGGGALLPDGRGWELVSPVEKNGGQVDPPGALFGGGVIQAAENGQSVTFSSAASFGGDAQGAPVGSQYVSSRGSDGWLTDDITAPMLSGSYGIPPDGVPYQLFSGDLTRGLLLNGHHCRGEAEGCPVPNPPLPGSGAPDGYQNYYLRDSASGGFQGLVNGDMLVFTPLSAAQFDLRLAGTAPDLRHVVLSTCAALSANATEAPNGDGCDSSRPNLYEWSGAGLSLINLLPGDAQGTPGASLAAQSGAISAGGTRVYWTSVVDGNLYLRADGQSRQVDAAIGGGGVFQTASADGSLAFYSKSGHLYRYDAGGAGSSADLTPSGGVLGVLGASSDGDYVYYLRTSGLFLWHGGVTTEVAATADSGNYPPSTGMARVSVGGTRLAFVSTIPLTGYDNLDLATGNPDPQVYLYEATGPSLTCASCNPTQQRPVGSSGIPGSIPNGSGPDVVNSYKPRALSADGRRLFFDSADALVLADTNSGPDVYQWEAQGKGACTDPGGCIALISSGKGDGGASFADASTSGSDAFFLTARSLVSSDPGSVDLYDAREGGGFPVPPTPIPCVGDACQILPPEPVDPALNTLITGPGNPPVRFRKPRCRRAHHRQRRGCQRGKQRGGHHHGEKRRRWR